MSYFKIENLSFEYNDNVIFKNFNYSIDKGDILIIKGRSGVGKTTLLRIISGLIKTKEGKIILDNKDITNEKIEKRKISYLFQNYSLFPHMSVEKNILYANKKANVNELLDLVNLNGYNKKYPHELSGGEYQRISLIRTLAIYPKLILLDEPFSNIDKQLRVKLTQDIKKIANDFNLTLIIVSHDTEELEKIATKTLEIYK